MIRTKQKVIVRNNGKLEVGIATNPGRKLNRRVYDVMLETGAVIPYVPIDSKRSKVSIDTELTKKILPQIKTNINLLAKGNVR